MSNSNHPEYSLPSLIAIVAAIWSFFTSAGFSILLAIVAIPFGIIGVLLAIRPDVRGGILSVFSILTALIGIVVAFLRLLF